METKSPTKCAVCGEWKPDVVEAVYCAFSHGSVEKSWVDITVEYQESFDVETLLKDLLESVRILSRETKKIVNTGQYSSSHYASIAACAIFHSTAVYACILDKADIEIALQAYAEEFQRNYVNRSP